MIVVKRDGREENVQFDKITKRIAYMCDDLIVSIDPVVIAQEVIARVTSGITTSELDILTSDFCASKISDHLDYGKLAARIIVDDHQKNCVKTFSEVCTILYNNKDNKGLNCPRISDEVYECSKNKQFEELVVNKRDFLLDYFGFKTLQRSYLLKVNDIVQETPQYMFLRVSIGIHGNNIEKVKQTYNLMSQKYFTHATPTLFNSGTPRPQLSSCYLVGTEDSIDGIFKSISDCARISKWSGGIGVHISNIRGNESDIRGTGGKSNGIVPMLRTYNETARYVNQGGKRNGSFAMYIEPWHCDIFQFLECKKNHGDENLRARDLFYALWIPDLFMERVFADEKWSLMCPSECPGLSDCYGDEFIQLYEKYEKEGNFKKQVDAKLIWEYIINSQIETGTPYMLYKDACNKKSNQKNIGVIKSSNLCAEIIEYSDSEETAVCNLASICLPMFVLDNGEYDYNKLGEVTEIITENLNKVIDINYYPTEEGKKSNMNNRPIGIGVQGLSDTFNKLMVGYDSAEARDINKRIFETIYYHAVKKSCEISKQDGPYPRYEGSPVSQGLFQFELWDSFELSDELDLDWNQLKNDVLKYGVRNSLLTALMPTASTSQIMGNSECFEPVTSNWYTRRTLAGEFVVLNKYLIGHLIKEDLWNIKVRNELIRDRGSIQNIKTIPQNIKDIYKTVWEIKQKVLVDLSADRGRFIDQSQSLNLFFDIPSYSVLSKSHYYGWKAGLKTGSYYIRSKPAINNDSVAVEEIIEEEECINCSA